MDSENSQDSRERILRAAMKVIAEKGYHAASLREIALEANVSKPLIHWYFGSKRNLIRMVARKSLPLSIAQECLDKGLAGRKLIECIIDEFMKTYSSNLMKKLLVHTISLSLEDPEVRDEYQKLCRDVLQQLAERVYGSASPRNTMKLRVLFGALLCLASNPLPEDPEEYKSLLLQLLCPEDGNPAGQPKPSC